MTTATSAIPALEVSVHDDNMDVLSDTGFDFGDGDIDLDLDTAPSVHDDDLSLHDVATDGELDTQELPADQDDFMADQGDLIEEDDVYNDDAAAATQPVDDSAATFETDMLALPDEDLIDYSDDEAQQPVKMHSSSVQEEGDVQVSFDIEATPATADAQQVGNQPQGDAQAENITEATHVEAETHDGDIANTLEQNVASPEHRSQESVQDNEDGDEDEVYADDDGGVALPADEHNDDRAVEETVQEDADNDSESDHHSDQQIELRPVTVNYGGNELWLFKQHDLDDSGDFLLQDLSVAKSSISDLFQACRLSLGDDVSGEHEIGFRFDHLHNLELYEDNTACVAVSLERLVDLYHTLQAQDGNEDPECFYVTLQFRPRFATLLADVAQYAEQGSGYSALEAAVAAGETHFSNVFSSASTEHDHVEWDEDAHEDDEASSPGSAHSNASQGAEVEEPNEEHHEDAEVEDEEEKSGQENPQQQAVETGDENSYTAPEAANVDASEYAAPYESTEQAEVGHDVDAQTAQEQHTSESYDERTPDQIAHDKQEAEDFVDYSDDEGEQEPKSMPAHEPSPSSSTVQGDEPTKIQESGPDAEHDKQDDGNAAETGFGEQEDDATLLTETQYGEDANHYAFQDYTESYDQGDPYQDFQADGTLGDPFEGNNTFNDDTNQDFADYNYQNLEGNINLGFDEQPLDDTNYDDHVDENFEAVEDVTHADALLDLDNAPEWAVDTDPASNLPGEDAVLVHDDITYEDEEGGANDQPAATTSTAADLALTSSNEHKPSSPQGQKRSIDEVGDGTDDAPDSTGMSPLLRIQKRFNTDQSSPDAKRPRV